MTEDITGLHGELLKYLRNSKVHNVEEICQNIKITKLEAIEMIALLEGMGFLKKGFVITDFGKELLEL